MRSKIDHSVYFNNGESEFIFDEFFHGNRYPVRVVNLWIGQKYLLLQNESKAPVKRRTNESDRLDFHHALKFVSPVQYIGNLWNKISYAGLTDDLPGDLQKKITIGNQATFTAGVVTSLCSLYYVKAPAQFVTFIGSAALCFVFVILNAFRLFNFSRIFFTIAIPGLIAAGGMFTPEYIKVAQMTGFIALITIPIVLFGITEKIRMIAGLAWIAVCFILFDSIHAENPDMPFPTNQAIEFQRQLQIFISIIAMLLFVFIFIYLQNTNYATEKKLNQSLQKAAQQNLKIREQNAEIESMNRELEKRMLRAQMNPHFLFNSLNSIQHFIAINDQDSALDYLSKLARMIRQALDNSANEYVPVADELKLLRHYLDLQSLKFGSDFSYTIAVDETIDVYSNEIPFLILQPYVENAILHGLENKNGKKNVTIEIKPCAAGIHCAIQDNGIGRKAALELKNQRREQYVSRGMLITSRRIEAMNNSGVQKMNVRIVDLTHRNGTPAGTRVEIDLPLDCY